MWFSIAFSLQSQVFLLVVLNRNSQTIGDSAAGATFSVDTFCLLDCEMIHFAFDSLLSNHSQLPPESLATVFRLEFCILGV